MSTTEIVNALSAEFPQTSIHWRAGATSPKTGKALALAYIDARDVMDRLDAVVTPEGWQSEHFPVGGRIGCKIGIKCGDEWVWKSDGAGDTDVEADKGAFSDAFKRAAVSWGIGRYLYGFGNTWVPCQFKEFNGKLKFIKFADDPWKFVDRKLTKPQQVAMNERKEAAARHDMGVTEIKTAMKELNEALDQSRNVEGVKTMWAEYENELAACADVLPDWFAGAEKKYKQRLTELMQLEK